MNNGNNGDPTPWPTPEINDFIEYLNQVSMSLIELASNYFYNNNAISKLLSLAAVQINEAVLLLEGEK